MYSVGQKITYATFDDQDADTRELDATTATVLAMESADEVRVESIYGARIDDVYAFLEAH